MKEETERLNELVDWYKCKLNEISEAPVDSRPRKLRKLYQCSEKNKGGCRRGGGGGGIIS